MAMSHARLFGFKDEVLHDAMLLLDRTMCSGVTVPANMLQLLVAACLMISARQGEPLRSPTSHWTSGRDKPDPRHLARTDGLGWDWDRAG